jgi:hypothetical protein
MRVKCIINSDRLHTQIRFEYNESGWLVGFQIVEDIALNKDLITGIIGSALTMQRLMESCAANGIKVYQEPADLSFDAFWKAYNYKQGGSKKKAEMIWLKMTDAQKAAAIAYIPSYNRHLAANNIPKAYATTYLNQERWNNG